MGPDGTYLGDGLYATVDRGFQIALTADRDGMRHVVYLDAEVFAALARFARAEMGWRVDEAER